MQPHLRHLQPPPFHFRLRIYLYSNRLPPMYEPPRVPARPFPPLSELLSFIGLANYCRRFTSGPCVCPSYHVLSISPPPHPSSFHPCCRLHCSRTYRPGFQAHSTGLGAMGCPAFRSVHRPRPTPRILTTVPTCAPCHDWSLRFPSHTPTHNLLQANKNLRLAWSSSWRSHKAEEKGTRRPVVQRCAF